jgi:signal transduction histidine kinase
MLGALVLVLVPVLLIGLVTRGATEQNLTLLVARDGRQRVEALLPCFAAYHGVDGTWDSLPSALDQLNGSLILPSPTSQNESLVLVSDSGPVLCVRVRVANLAERPLSTLIDGLPLFLLGQSRVNPEATPVAPGLGILRGDRRGPLGGAGNAGGMGNLGEMQTVLGLSLAALRDRYAPETMILTDAEGVIVSSSNGDGVGQQLAADALAQSSPVVVENQVVGWLVVGTALGKLNESQRQLLEAVNGALIVSGGVAILLALGMGWWMSSQIAAPVRDLMAGARRLARGTWSEPLAIRARNEFGELTRAFNQMAAEIIRQQQLNRQMVADVAHDLRTPLSAMALEIEAIEAGFQSPAQATSSLREEIRWLQRLVDDLRTLSLMDADQLRLQVESVPLSDFLGSVLDFWQTLAEEDGIALTLEAPADLPTIAIDPGRLRQVLGNLIDNAIRHTRAGQRITLHASLNGAAPENAAVLIQVSDEGDGIQPEDLPHIFDRFYRADPARRRLSGRSDGGSGLGLSIARQLVEMHKGTISADSAPGKGTTFTIRLPLNASPAGK